MSVPRAPAVACPHWTLHVGSDGQRGQRWGTDWSGRAWGGWREGKQGERPISRANSEGPGKGRGRGRSNVRAAAAGLPAFQLQTLTCSLSFQECPVRGGSCQGEWTGPRSGGPGRWPAALTLSWPRSASPADTARRPWWAYASGGVGASPGLWPICVGSHSRACAVMSEIFVL